MINSQTATLWRYSRGLEPLAAGARVDTNSSGMNLSIACDEPGRPKHRMCDVKLTGSILGAL
jgi:hypothetical protein